MNVIFFFLDIPSLNKKKPGCGIVKIVSDKKILTFFKMARKFKINQIFELSKMIGYLLWITDFEPLDNRRESRITAQQYGV